MKIFLITSKSAYGTIPPIKKELESAGHVITLPNCYDDTGAEERQREMGRTQHAEWKSQMLRHSTNVIEGSDAVLVLNVDKNGVKNYIGGATFLEMYDAFRLGKKIYLLNEVPDGSLKDEIFGFQPVALNGDLAKIA